MTDTRQKPAAATPGSRTGERIVLAHGGGGQLTDELLAATVMPRLGNETLGQLLDSAILAPIGDDRPAMTLDGYVVQPWRFPGGDIGRLAVCGTVNDLAVAGAKPLGLALGLILAEGFARADLDVVLDSIANAAEEAQVRVVTGDTKVVGAAQVDGIYLTTAGLGRVPRQRSLSPRNIRPGDVIVLSGPIGEHGLAVMLARELPEVQSVLKSDVAPLAGMIASLLEAVPDVAFMRYPTRSGLAGVAADLAEQSGRRIVLDESAIPVRPEARHAAEMLGLDPLEVANEGKVVVVVRPEDAESALEAMRNHLYGREAQIIGRVEQEMHGVCELLTDIGGRRILQKPYGEQLPRIC